MDLQAIAFYLLSAVIIVSALAVVSPPSSRPPACSC